MVTDSALAALRAILRARVSVAAATLSEHAQGESLVAGGRPDAVVFPRATAEVAALAAWSTAHAVPLVGWGEGVAFQRGACAPRTVWFGWSLASSA